jgi:hypothetical protein
MVPVTTGYEVRDGKAVWAGRQLRDWIPDLVEAVVARFDPVQLIVFGSVASATDGPDSDLDVLVVLDDAPVEHRRELMVELRKATRAVHAPRGANTPATMRIRYSVRPGMSCGSSSKRVANTSTMRSSSKTWKS